MNRDNLVEEFIVWFNKPENYKDSYKTIITKSKLLTWDQKFFNSQVFEIDESDIDSSISKIWNLVYNIEDPEWEQLNFTVSSGAPQAILGDKNYISFLKEYFKQDNKAMTFPKRHYFSYTTNVGSLDILSPLGKEFEFRGLSQLLKDTKTGDLVFFVQRGDKTPWPHGLISICKITKGPYEIGYNKIKNPKKTRDHFKVKLTPLLVLPKPINRPDLIGYFQCYDIRFIGPMTKNEPNQANSLLTENQARALTGVILEMFPKLKADIEKIFGVNFPLKANKATEPPKINKDIKVAVNVVDNQPRNLIIYGAPGTGKSYMLNERVQKYFKNDYLYTRITFHSNYSYRNFVGSYKPKPIYRDSDKPLYKSDLITEMDHRKEPLIEYAFEPGPFLTMLQRAIENPEHNFVIIIEELNRANTASVFGDVFQLLDRKHSGESEYATALEPSAMDYLKSIGIEDTEIKIPRNLYLWATMNNADQGVLPLDSAFKRRWAFEHISLNKNEGARAGHFIKLSFLDQEDALEWNKFRNLINEKLIDLGIQEDKLIGPFFLSEAELKNSEVIKHKLFLYLKDDVLRYKSGIFKSDLRTFSQICEKYDRKKNVFDDNINWLE